MEYDSVKTFRDIHNDLSSLKAGLAEIEKKALNRAKQRHGPLQLRFLTPLKPQPKSSENVVHLRLTPLGEHTTESPYVAVSYTWNQPAGLQDLFQDILPEYRIWTTDPQPKAPRCSSLVLHRALHFARERMETPLIWIDQECIDQSDSVDVENHLQSMHEIYCRSAATAVVLSRMIFRMEFFDALNALSKQYDTVHEFLTAERLLERRRSLHLALMHIAEDPWFKRTWTFQERHCAGPCSYLIPVDPELPGCKSIADKFYVEQTRLIEIWNTAEAISADQTLRPSLKDYNIVAHLSMLIKYRFQASRSNNKDIVAKLSKAAKPTFYAEVFYGMERCENDVVSDRVAIFANVCQFHWTLQSTLLRDPRFSYSTCVLTLLILNFRAETGFSTINNELLDRALDMNIGDLLRELAEMHSGTKERPPDASPFEEWLDDPGPQHLV